MTVLHNLTSVLAGKTGSHTLCMPLVFGYAATSQGISLRRYLRSGEYIAQCQLNCQRKFGYDAVFVYGDNCVEAEALGSKVHFPENAYPYMAEHLGKDKRSLKKLSLPDPNQDGRMPELLKAARILKADLGDDVPIIGIALGPMSIASQLMGLENLLYLIIDSPQDFQALLVFTSQVCLQYTLALLEAGVHITALIDPCASPSVIPADIFSQYLLPHFHSIFNKLKRAGSLAAWLIITGNTTSILHYYSSARVDLALIDYEVSLEEAMKEAPNLVLAGNIKPYSFVNKNPGEIYLQSRELISSVPATVRFILSSGCELPLDAKAENLTALIRAARGDSNGC